MISEQERQFLEKQRIARLATADATGHPHVVPVCFVLEATNVYISIDEKPKKPMQNPLKRIRNLLENPAVALVADYYEDEDWSQLGWVMLQGKANLLYAGKEHDFAQNLLRQRYSQYAKMALQTLPVIAVRVQKVASWGKLSR